MSLTEVFALTQVKENLLDLIHRFIKDLSIKTKSMGMELKLEGIKKLIFYNSLYLNNQGMRVYSPWALHPNGWLLFTANSQQFKEHMLITIQFILYSHMTNF